MKKQIPFLTVFLIVAFLSCQETKVEVSAVETARQELTQAVESQMADGAFKFKAYEDGSSLAVAFQNKETEGRVVFEVADSLFLLGFYAERTSSDDKLAIRQAHLVRQDSSIRIEIRDMANELIETRALPFPDDLLPPPAGGYENIEDCLNDFYCSTKYRELLDQANETCEDVYYGVLCCLKDGFCYWVDFILIEPTNPSCRVRIFPLDIPLVSAQL